MGCPLVARRRPGAARVSSISHCHVPWVCSGRRTASALGSGDLSRGQGFQCHKDPHAEILVVEVAAVVKYEGERGDIKMEQEVGRTRTATHARRGQAVNFLRGVNELF